MKIVATPGVRKSVWLIAAALALVALAVLLTTQLATTRNSAAGAVTNEPPRPARGVVSAPAHEPDAKAAASRRARRITDAGTQAPAPASVPDAAPVQPGEPLSREDVPFSLGKPGETSGIKLFPAMGTKPTLIGIVVPDDFEVPEGYLRHFQANEDGELLPAILLFHPDYEWVDESGEVIPLPANRIVPPELAPPGLPIQLLEIPSARGDAR